jgi:hypothetical protein
MLNEEKFVEVIAMFCEFLGRPMLSKMSLDFYYDSIKEMETDAFTRRATEIYRGRKYSTLPTAADFLNLPDDQDAGMLAAETVIRLMEAIGGDADLQHEDPVLMLAVDAMGGWVACCEAVSQYEIDKLGIWKRDFAAVYKASARRDQARAPQVLFGRHSQSNITRGYLNPSTGELKNLIGETIEVKPWGDKALPGGPVALLQAKTEPLPAEELQSMFRGLSEKLDAERAVPAEMMKP